MVIGVNYANQVTGLYPQYNVEGITPVRPVDGVDGYEPTGAIDKTKEIECQTCKNRRYVDSSSDGNVSYKSPTHISPEASAAAVMSHEMEHVANARAEGAKEGRELISATVSLQVSSCPECGKSYVSGGTTRTQIKYTESNPYEQGRKTIEGSFLIGQNVDERV